VQGLRRTSPMVAARPGKSFVAAVGGLEGFRGAELTHLPDLTPAGQRWLGRHGGRGGYLTSHQRPYPPS
jgi:hypothetical protein